MGMKIALAKIGANISFSCENGSAANADILYALRSMKGHGHTFTACTKKTRNTVLPKAVAFKDIQDVNSFNEFDVVLVFNGSINFYGGLPDNSVIALYKALHNTTIPIIFVHTDGAMYFHDLWPMIAKREWAKNWSPEEFKVNPTNLYYITQGRNQPKVLDFIKKSKNHVLPYQIHHFPWERTILSGADTSSMRPSLSQRNYDLGFGGYIRNSHKQRRIEHYYDEPDLKTLLFGNLRGIKVKHTKVLPKVPFQSMITYMSDCRSSVIVGDQFYNDNFHTLRMYENLIAGCAILIDKQLDTTRDFYMGVPNGELFYVEKPSQVRDFLFRDDFEELVTSARRALLEIHNPDALNRRLNSLLEDICDLH